MTEPVSSQVDAAAVNKTYSRVLTHADRLFEALAELETSGGLKGLARQMRPASLERLTSVLKSIRQSIDGQLQQVKGLRR
jgi:hypothetical protein